MPDIDEAPAGGIAAIRKLLWVMAAVAALLGGLFYFGLEGSGADNQAPVAAKLPFGGPFELIAADGSVLTEKNLAGKPYASFFGCTRCPDVCPTTLSRMALWRKQLGKDGDKFNIVFVSVDPARDSPEALAQYIQPNGFPKDIVGLTGTLDELQQAVGSFKTTFSRDEETDGTTGYLVSHSSILYLMDENWKLQTYFTPDESAESIASCLAKLS